MIPIARMTEPPDFDRRIRQPGRAAIDELVGRPARTGRKTSRRQVADREEDIPADQFPPRWRLVLDDMLELYERRCAYLAVYLEPGTSSPTIDHIVPKSQDWRLVYEWTNYCLCAVVVNAKKGELLTLVDPFSVEEGWFALNLATFEVELGPKPAPSSLDRISATLPILNLRGCCRLREEYVNRYRLGPPHGIDLQYLEWRAPFVALELRRQGALVRRDC